MPRWPERTIDDYFWAKIDVTPDCWIWTGPSLRGGYGYLYPEGQAILAHRFSYAIYYGDLPNNMVILHKCDSPPCVNPDHLFAGTMKENIMDMWAKHRQAPTNLTRRPGSLNGMAKLTESEVSEIRSSSLSVQALSKKFGIHTTSVARILDRSRWKDVI